MRKLKDLLHPGRSAHVARLRLWAHINLRLFAFHSQRHFKGDPRYDLKNVTEGFVPRFDRSSDDTDLLERICRAYARTISRPQPVPACYEPTEWWKDLRQTCLGPVMRALEEGNVGALRVMYSRFFRDRCATGLTGVPYGMLKAYFHGPIRDVYRHTCMGDALYRIDCWLSQTDGRFGLPDLAGPGIGDPCGVVIDGTLVRPGSEYQHYCAHKILDRRRAVRGG
jgi:hypothetical protein